MYNERAGAQKELLKEWFQGQTLPLKGQGAGSMAGLPSEGRSVVLTAYVQTGMLSFSECM